MLSKMAATVVETYKDVYPELEVALPHVVRVIVDEERKYARSQAVGERKLEEAIRDCKAYHQQIQGIVLLELEALTGRTYIPDEDREFFRDYIEKHAEWRVTHAGMCGCELCTEMSKPDRAAYLAPVAELIKCSTFT